MSNRVLFVPLERIRDRYSFQWRDWFQKSFAKYGVNNLTVGDDREHFIREGEFLDIYDTCSYKAEQLREIIGHIQSGFEGTIFFMDMWFPGLEMVAYMRDLACRKIRIEGIAHAGTWISTDFLTQKGCSTWGSPLEKSWFKIMDRVYVGTQWHKEEIVRGRHVNPDKITVVKFPVYSNEELRKTTPKEDIVVFPSRLAPEKQPGLFTVIRAEFLETYGPIATFLRTYEECKDKEEYYALLARAKVAVSTSIEETFGIAMQEAANLGCFPVVPNRLCYPEVFNGVPRYNDRHGASTLIKMGLDAAGKGKYWGGRYGPSADDIVSCVCESI